MSAVKIMTTEMLADYIYQVLSQTKGMHIEVVEAAKELKDRIETAKLEIKEKTHERL